MPPPPATSAASLAAAARAAGADYYALLPGREVLVGAQPLGSKLQLTLEPGLDPELHARVELAALRRRRAALLQAQLEAERRGAVRPVSSNARALDAAQAPPPPPPPPSPPQAPAPMSPPASFATALSRAERAAWLADQRAVARRQRLEEEWEAQRRARVAGITHHALPASAGGAPRPPSPGRAPRPAAAGPGGESASPLALPPAARRAARRPRAAQAVAAGKAEEEAAADADADAADGGGDRDVWSPPPPRPWHPLVERARQLQPSCRERTPQSPGAGGDHPGLAGPGAHQAAHWAAGGPWAEARDLEGEAAGGDAAGMWVWRPGSAARLGGGSSGGHRPEGSPCPMCTGEWYTAGFGACVGTGRLPHACMAQRRAAARQAG
jgi:hypothetical protein